MNGRYQEWRRLVFIAAAGRGRRAKPAHMLSVRGMRVDWMTTR
jgi:hypothetical protein